MKDFISFSDGGNLIVRIKIDGNIELGDGVQIDEASSLFYEMLSRMLVDGIPVMAHNYANRLIKAGDRMAGRIELLEHHKLADDHDIIARKMWIAAKDEYK